MSNTVSIVLGGVEVGLFPLDYGPSLLPESTPGDSSITTGNGIKSLSVVTDESTS